MYPKQYIEFLAHFHGDRDYFECHEILEEYWKEIDKNNKQSVWVGLILLAVSCYHHRRNNFNGAIRTLHKAIVICNRNKQEIISLGIDFEQLLKDLESKLSEIRINKKNYIPYYIPFTDTDLQTVITNCCQEKNMLIDGTYKLADESLIHRHKVRDRSNVIAERNEALQRRSK